MTKQPLKGRNRERAGLMFVAPFIVVFLTFFVTPLFYSAYLSVFKQTLVGGNHFVGLANYAKALVDPQFRTGLWHVALFFVLQVPVMLVLATGLALAIDSGKLRGAKFYRIVAFLPYAVPAVVSAVIWGYLYGPNYGLAAQLSRYMPFPKIDFLSAGLALPSLANIVTWEFTGYNMIIMYAALKSISTDLYEAAAVDGAGAIRIAWSIKLPALRPAIFLTFLFSVIGTFQLFTEPYNLANVAPMVFNNSYTPNIYAYSTSFTSLNQNYAAALSFLLGFVVIIMSGALTLVARNRRES